MCLDYHQKMNGMRLRETKIGEKIVFWQLNLIFCIVYACIFLIDEMEKNSSTPFMERLCKFGGNNAANRTSSKFRGSFLLDLYLLCCAGKCTAAKITHPHSMDK